MKVNVGKR